MNNSLLASNPVLDFTNQLKSKGLSSEDISKILLDIVVEVEMELVEELIERLPKEKVKLLQQMANNNVSSGAIAEKLDLNEQEMQEIEMRKFKEIIQSMSSFLNY